jgi:hypothetical protein
MVSTSSLMAGMVKENVKAHNPATVYGRPLT